MTVIPVTRNTTGKRGQSPSTRTSYLGYGLYSPMGDGSPATDKDVLRDEVSQPSISTSLDLIMLT